MGKSRVNSISEITYSHFKAAVLELQSAPITSRAPLGYSSDTVLLYGNNDDERRSGVSLRNHSGSIKALICCPSGYFLYHGGYDKDLPTRLIARGLFRSFTAVKHKIQ